MFVVGDGCLIGALENFVVGVPLCTKTTVCWSNEPQNP